MDIPKMFKGMELVKTYADYVLYKNKYYRECFRYNDLGVATEQIKERKVYSRIFD